MAVLNFPVPYAEELLYSTVARAGVRQGLTSPKQLLDEVFKSRSVIATIDLPNHLEIISRWLPHEFTAEKLIYDHTLFPIYAPFVPEARRLECIKWLCTGTQGAVHLALGVAASRIKVPRFVRYCPGCLAAQREQYGEYFWLREWQITGIESCPEHGVLVDTRIARPLVECHRFTAAAPEHCFLARQGKGIEGVGWVTAQIRQLLTRPEQTSPSFEQWTSYYRSLACRLGFCRGSAQIDHASIRERVLQILPAAWLTRNHLMPLSLGVDESDWLKAIFRKHRKSFNYLQHIVVHQALLGNNWQIAEVIEEVSLIPENKKFPYVQIATQNMGRKTPDQENWLALLLCHSPKQARKASPALYARLYRNHRDWLLKVNHHNADRKSASSTHRVDWVKRDLECLQALLQLATFLKTNQQRPRCSRTYYFKQLRNHSTLEKNLYQMPLSMAFLAAHTESIEQYQIRRLQNAYDYLRSLFDSPPQWRLLRSAKLSEERLTGPARLFLENLVDMEHEVQRRRK